MLSAAGLLPPRAVRPRKRRDELAREEAERNPAMKALP
jgi:hypothetical protein